MSTTTEAISERLLSTGFGMTSTADAVTRLPSITREMAARALAGTYGRQMERADFGLSQEIIADLSPVSRYAETVRLIAQKAPLRVVPLERLAGSAPLLEAPHHLTPAMGEDPIRSTSHTTLDFEKALHVGYAGLQEEIQRRLGRGDLDADGVEQLNGMLVCIDAAGIWHDRYVAELSARVARSDDPERQRYQEVLDVMERVPEHPPQTFYEALQALWEFWEFQRLCGNWSGLGRVDKMLGPFLERDLQTGRITLDDARDLLAHFWLKGAEWIGASSVFTDRSGDAQFYQNVVLSGVDESGHDVTNPVTFLVLDVVEELHISDFPVAVRVSKNSPDRLWRRIAEVQRTGGGIISLYNEDLVIRALTRFGFPLADARNFANDGCWEVLIPGKTCFTYTPFDTLELLQDVLGTHPERPGTPDYTSFEELYATFGERLAATIRELYQSGICDDVGQVRPTPLLDLWVDGCIEKGRGYNSAGPRYTAIAPHAGGLVDTANSLYAIKRLVFDQQRVSFGQMRDILQDDWAGHERLQSEVQHSFVLYGNDDDEADAMLARVYDTYVSLCETTERAYPRILRPPGISTFGREVVWSSHRTATPFGRNAGDILSSNLSPMPGSEHGGPTAVIKSYAKQDFERLPNGVPLDMKLLPTTLRGEVGQEALVTPLKTFVSLGGWYIQPDVVDSDLLRDAQQHPERYPNLTVRISGWSARFATLRKEYQDMVIQRTAHQTGVSRNSLG